MPLLTVVGIVMLAGLAIYVVKALPFIDESMKRLATILIVVAVVVWFVSLLFGVHLGNLRIGR